MPGTTNPNKDGDSQKTNSSLQTIRTLKSDMSDVLKKGEVSLTSAFLKQGPGENGEGMEPTGGSKKNFTLFIALGSILAAAAIFGIIYSSLIKKEAGPQPTILIQPEPILTSQEKIVLEVTDQASLKEQTQKALANTYKIGDLIYAPIEKRTESGLTYFLETNQLFSFLNASTPVFLTSFLKNNFFFGVINLEKNYPVLIFEINEGEYDSAFAGMLKWEKHLPEDLSFMVRDEAAPEEEAEFKDKIIKNQSVRIIEKNGESLLLYSIFNEKYIIITENAGALQEIIQQFIRFKLS